MYFFIHKRFGRDDYNGTYTYDSANQLVSSVAPDGKVTNYAYDAAGRMIKEGDKTYEYGWLDKVLKVTENGKTLADFEYHNNGQIAKAIRPDKTENFLWDGLALVKRDDTKFINEPHAGGGNPVLAIQDVDADKSKAIFTDMLGTSLGSTVEDQYNNITKTSFGADTTDTSAFFTGKPYINELGYTFLFRNYRADTGKWLSQDLIGYPDGWNNFSYCGNNTSYSIEVFGAWGVNFSISLSGGVVGSAGVSLSIGFTCGNDGFSWGWTYSGNGGLTTPGVGVRLKSTYLPAAENLSDLGGFTQEYGGSVGVGITIGGEVVMTPGSIEGIALYMSFPALSEAHATVTESVVTELQKNKITIDEIIME